MNAHNLKSLSVVIWFLFANFFILTAADRYWVGGSGTWNGASTANWSTSSGGATGASVPTSSDNVFFDANSNSGSNFTVTLGADVVCLKMDWTGADDTYVPTIATDGTSRNVSVHGDFILCSGLIWGGQIYRIDLKGSSSSKVDTKNISNLNYIEFGGTSKTYTLESDLTCEVWDQLTGITIDVLPAGGTPGTDEVDVTVTRSWYNDGTFNARSNNSATVTLEGSINYDLGWSGGAATTFHNLTINLSTSSLAREMQTDITVNNNLTLTQGDIDLNGFDLNLGSSATVVSETTANRIFGTSGVLKTTRDIGAAWSSETFGNMGLSITTDIDPGEATISRGHARQSRTDGNEGISRYFIITPTTNTGLNATLIFNYLDAEIPGGESFDETEFALYRSTDGGSTWGLEASSTPNAAGNNVQLTGIDAFSYWTVSDDVNSPLPIELISFTARKNQDYVELEWKTESELNNHHFELDKAGDDLAFRTIHQQPGAGTSTAPQGYTYNDFNPTKGISYYLLRQVDYNGEFEEFGPIAVNFEGGLGELAVFPNPTTKNVTVQYTGGITSKAGSITLIDQSGKIHLEQNIKLADGANSFLLNLEKLSNGIYTLKLTDFERNEAKVQKVVKY